MSNEPVSILLDIETLSTDPRAVVLSIACVPFLLGKKQSFNEIMNSGFIVKIAVEEQVKRLSRTIDKGTVDWWKKQDKEVFDSMVRPAPHDVSPREAITKLSKFISTQEGFSKKDSYIWSRGTNFDFPIIESLYKDLCISIPFNTWKIRDIRTAIDILAGVDDGKYSLRDPDDSFIAHNPLHDAAMDAARLNELFQIALEG